jgi:hypothetical protein
MEPAMSEFENLSKESYTKTGNEIIDILASNKLSFIEAAALFGAIIGNELRYGVPRETGLTIIETFIRNLQHKATQPLTNPADPSI